uniref:cysteine dioxygenase n=1 Tax=Oryza sativa subsp. japonica TaxID=39947 RepID=Q2R8H5_ORYSJ|nr:hypothetical protein LOC_Os11g12170 [Oryza sativa Japonica Group]
MDQSEHHHRLAVVAADWCLRLYGWLVTTPLSGVYIFTAGLLSPPPTSVSACTLAYYATVDGRLRLHRPACLRRRRLVSPSARLAYYAAVVGRLRLHRPAASTAADWCFRLHGWPIMLPLLGVYVFTDRLALVRRRLVLPPARWPIMLPLLGVYVFTDRLALVRRRLVLPPARWPIMPPLMGVYVFTDRPPRPPPTGASACTAGLLCCRCWASTSSPTGLPSSAADWCFRLHG